MSEYDTVWAFTECVKIAGELDLDIHIKDHPVAPNGAYLELTGILVPEGLVFAKVEALYDYLCGAKAANDFYLSC